MNVMPCPTCDGARLRPESLHRAGRRQEHPRGDRACRSATAWSFFAELQLSDQGGGDRPPDSQGDPRAALAFWSTSASTTSPSTAPPAPSPAAKGSASAWRPRSAPRLVGVLYILDEPSIGLHQRDNARLLETLKRLRDLGNTVLVVEHDEETILEADHVIDMGPGAGVHGGEVVAQGTPRQMMDNPASLTGQIPVRRTVHPGAGRAAASRSLASDHHRRHGEQSQGRRPWRSPWGS